MSSISNSLQYFIAQVAHNSDPGLRLSSTTSNEQTECNFEEGHYKQRLDRNQPDKEQTISSQLGTDLPSVSKSLVKDFSQEFNSSSQSANCDLNRSYCYSLIKNNSLKFDVAVPTAPYFFLPNSLLSNLQFATLIHSINSNVTFPNMVSPNNMCPNNISQSSECYSHGNSFNNSSSNSKNNSKVNDYLFDRQYSTNCKQNDENLVEKKYTSHNKYNDNHFKDKHNSKLNSSSLVNNSESYKSLNQFHGPPDPKQIEKAIFDAKHHKHNCGILNSEACDSCDTGYSSRCSTPPGSSSPSSVNSDNLQHIHEEENKHGTKRHLELPKPKWQDNNRDSRSSSPSDSSISSQGSSYSNTRWKKRFQPKYPCNASHNGSAYVNSHSHNYRSYGRQNLQYYSQQSHYTDHVDSYDTVQKSAAGAQHNGGKQGYNYSDRRHYERMPSTGYNGNGSGSHFNKFNYHSNNYYGDKYKQQSNQTSNSVNYNNSGYSSISRMCYRSNLIMDQIKRPSLAGKFVHCKEQDFKVKNTLRMRLCDYKAEVKDIPEDLLNGSDWDRLSQQVWQKFQQSQQKDSTFEKKLRLRDFIYDVIWNVLPKCRLFIVGSSLSGFGADTSDVDMCLMMTAGDLDQKTTATLVLSHLQRELNNCGQFQKMELIRAKVPILKFRDSISQIEVDLNCNNEVGIRNTHLLNAYSQLDWRVRPLVLVVKLWAQYHKINNAKDMTISSYSLVLMVLHFLQRGVQPPVLPCLQKLLPEVFHDRQDVTGIPIPEYLPKFISDNKETLGELFLGFLDYYANQYRHMYYAMSVRIGNVVLTDKCRYGRSKKNDSRMWKYLCIEEPFDRTNTARSVYDEAVFERIKKVFSDSYKKLKEEKNLASILKL